MGDLEPECYCSGSVDIGIEEVRPLGRIGTGKEHDLVYLVCRLPTRESSLLIAGNIGNSRPIESMGVRLGRIVSRMAMPRCEMKWCGAVGAALHDEAREAQ